MAGFVGWGQSQMSGQAAVPSGVRDQRESGGLGRQPGNWEIGGLGSLAPVPSKAAVTLTMA